MNYEDEDMLLELWLEQERERKKRILEDWEVKRYVR